MIYAQKRIDHAISLIRQRAWHDRNFFDAEPASSAVLSNFYNVGSRRSCLAHNQLDVVHDATDSPLHLSFCRSTGVVSSRHLFSLSARWTRGHAATVTYADPIADSSVLPYRKHCSAPGRHSVSPQRQPSQQSQLLVSRGPATAVVLDGAVGVSPARKFARRSLFVPP
jgi:hypothetical protein